MGPGLLLWSGAIGGPRDFRKVGAVRLGCGLALQGWIGRSGDAGFSSSSHLAPEASRLASLRGAKRRGQSPSIGRFVPRLPRRFAPRNDNSGLGAV